jgi:hypothetical protein
LCSCEPGFLCSRCAGTPDDPGYVDDDPRDERDDDAEKMRRLADVLTAWGVEA